MMVAPAATSPANGPVLRDIHLPPAPSWWPPAPGWWLVLGLLLLCTGLGLWFWRRQRQRRAVERALLAAVDALVTQYRQQPQRLAAELHALLRRAAMRFDHSTSRLGGEAWKAMLSSVTVDVPTVNALASLETAMYQPNAEFDVDAASAAVRRWLWAAWRHQGKTTLDVRAAALLPESGHA